MEIHEKIQELLDWSDLQQKDLAEKTGIATSTISSYIRGKRRIPIEAVEKIAEALGVSPWTIFNRKALPANPLELDDEEIAIIEQYRDLPLEERKMVKFHLSSLHRLSRKYQLGGDLKRNSTVRRKKKPE